MSARTRGVRMTSLLRLLPLSIGMLILPMHAHPPAGDEPAHNVRQGTVARLREHSLAIERVDVLGADDAVGVRLTVTPEPRREWAASGEFVQGEVLPLSEGCYRLARLQRAEGGERGSVLVKGPIAASECTGAEPGNVPVFAGEAGSRVGDVRLAMPAAPAGGPDEAVELVLWPGQYTLASSPPESQRRERLASGQAVTLGQRRYALAAVHPRAGEVPAFIELKPLD